MLKIFVQDMIPIQPNQHPEQMLDQIMGHIVTLQTQGCDGWYMGEHHVPFMLSIIPELVLLSAYKDVQNAVGFNSMRFGIMGAQLKTRQANRLAEMAKMMKVLMNDRFDLGISKGVDPGPDSEFMEQEMLHRPPNAEILSQVVAGNWVSQHPMLSMPSIWLCGNSEQWVLRAAQLKVNVNMGCFDTLANLTKLVKQYKAVYPEGRIKLTVAIIAGTSKEDVLERIKDTNAIRQGNKRFAGHYVIGTTKDISDSLHEIADTLDIDEIILHCPVFDVDERYRCFGEVIEEAKSIR